MHNLDLMTNTVTVGFMRISQDKEVCCKPKITVKIVLT